MDTTMILFLFIFLLFVLKPWLSYKWTWKLGENIRCIGGGGEIITDI